jgi:hypothetical protein
MSLSTGQALAGAYSDAILATPGLSGYWRLNETVNNGMSTTWADASGNGHTGAQIIHIARVPVLGTPGPRPVSGFLGFEGTNASNSFNRHQSILVQDAPSLNLLGGNFTMEAWVQTTSNDLTISILGKHDNLYANGYLMMLNYLNTSGQDVGARFRNTPYAGQLDPQDTPTPFSAIGNDGKWHHVTAVLHRNGGGAGYSASGMSVFLDGALAGYVHADTLDATHNPPYNNTNISTTNPLAIGAGNNDGGNGFIGNIDEVAIYQRALSPAEVAAHYQTALTGIFAANAAWNVDSNGSWSSSANWLGGVPNATGATANFGTIITAARTVSIDAPATVGSINFSSPIAYAIDGSATLTLSVASGNASIHTSAGSHNIAAPVTLASDLNVTTDAATSLALTGSLAATGKAIAKGGTGTLQVQNILADALNVTAGSVVILPKATPNSPAGTSVLETLAIAPDARLDLTNNSLILNYTGTSPIATVRSYLKTGSDSGNGILTSSGTASLRIGYAEASDLSIGTFAGQNVDTTAIVMELTLAGDADLDLTVDSIDFNRFIAGYGISTDATWTSGDFNYDAKVNTIDFNHLAGNFGLTAPATSTNINIGSVVPEPATGAIVLLVGSSTLRRRIVA